MAHCEKIDSERNLGVFFLPITIRLPILAIRWMYEVQKATGNK